MYLEQKQAVFHAFVQYPISMLFSHMDTLHQTHTDHLIDSFEAYFRFQDVSSHTLASTRPRSKLWALLILASNEVCRSAPESTSSAISAPRVLSWISSLCFSFSAKSVKIAAIEPGLALAEKGHQVTIVCPIKAKKEVPTSH